MRPKSTTHYVYTLARPTDAPDVFSVFYVGKGQNKRVSAHETEARTDCACHRCRVIRKIWKQGGEVQRSIVFTSESEEEAYACEKETIARYGLATLTNTRDGGRGGGNPSEETRARIGASSSERWADPVFKARHSEKMKANFTDPDFRERNRLAQPPASPERFANASAARKKVWSDPVHRERQRIAREAAHNAPGYRENMAAKTRARWENNPELRERVTAINKARANDPAHKENYRSKIKAIFADPAKRAQMSEKLKAAWADPEKRSKRAAAAQARKAAKKAKEDCQE